LFADETAFGIIFGFFRRVSVGAVGVRPPRKQSLPRVHPPLGAQAICVVYRDDLSDKPLVAGLHLLDPVSVWVVFEFSLDAGRAGRVPDELEAVSSRVIVVEVIASLFGVIADRFSKHSIFAVVLSLELDSLTFGWFARLIGDLGFFDLDGLHFAFQPRVFQV